MSTDTPARVSVVICAYTEERWTELRAAVDSVLAQTRPVRDVVVVADNNEGLLERARGELDGATVVPNVQESGLAGARNSGALAAQGELIAFLDDDAVADPFWVQELEYGFGDPSVMGVGGVVDPLWAGSRPVWFPEEFNWTVGCTYRGMPTEAAPLRNLIGANMAIRREVFDAVDGFRPELGRLEETEFCIRASQRFPERRWLYWPPARVRHRVSTQRATWRFFVRRCHNEGLAKATMVELTTRQAGLASERAYVRRALPLGVLTGLRDALRGDAAGARRAGAIVAGLTCTVAGYARGRVRIRLSGASAAPRLARRGNTP